MRFLIDEDVPDSVAKFLEEKGHEVVYAREIVLPGTPDEVIAALGNENEAVVVTCNTRDYKKIASRTVRSRAKLRKLGLICLRCGQPNGRKRVEQVIDAIEYEYEKRQTLRDERLIIEIFQSFVKIYR